MQPQIHFLILSIMILTTTVCNAQVGVVTNNLTLNDPVEIFITNSNCDENELNELVRIIQKQGDLLQGLRVMNVAVKRFPDSYYAHYMRGFYNQNLENFEEAISDFSKASQSNLDTPEHITIEANAIKHFIKLPKQMLILIQL